MEGSRTPKRQILGEINNLVVNPDSSPLSPTANLKLLTKVATNVSNLCAYDQESCKAKQTTPQCNREIQVDENQRSRKEKSLNLLCNRFLQLYPLNLTEESHMMISLDEVAGKLGTERRRIYDIINVLESLQMAVKAGKNQYIWYGCQYLNHTLSQLKGLALKFGIKEKVQSLQLKESPVQFHVISNVCTSKNESFELSLSSQALNCTKQTSAQLNFCRIQPQTTTTSESEKVEDIDTKVADTKPNEVNPDDSSGLSGACLCKDERSLGVLCQKFIMLFLISDKSDLINLDLAAKILLNENSWDVLKNKSKDDSDQDKLQSCATAESHVKKSCDSHDSTESGNGKIGKFKTKARRLYDIANVLTSLELICKVRTAGSTRKPAFKYTGPNVDASSFSDKDMLLLQTTRQSLLGSSCLNLKLGCRLACMKMLDTDRAEEIQVRRTYSNQGPRKKKSSTIPSSEEGSSLSKILKVAEMELQRLESIKTPDKEHNRLNSVKAEVTARKKLFPSHDSEAKEGLDRCMGNKADFNGSIKDDAHRASMEVMVAHRIKTKNKASTSTKLNPGKEIRITRKLVKVSPIKIHNVTVLPKLNPLMLRNLPQKESTEGSIEQVFRLPKDIPLCAKINGDCSANPAAERNQPVIAKYQFAEPVNLAGLPVCTKSLNNVPILFISNPDILIGKHLVCKGRNFTSQNSSVKADSNSFIVGQPTIDSNIHLVPFCNNGAFHLK